MKLSTLALVAILAAFGAGLIGIFGISFERGEVYPPNSSFRTDPLGCRLFYDSLRALPGRTVERNLDASLDPGAATVLLLGTPAFGLSDAQKEVDARTVAGARLVFSLNPVTRPGRLNPSRLKWGATVDFGKSSAVVDAGNTARETLVYFDNLDLSWRVLKNGRLGPVVIERALNKGSLVLSAESFPFTNEALARSRDADLLAAVVGPNARIIFDEYHLGVRQNPGVALLMRKFRLHALLAAVAVAALLFVWSVSSPFPPVAGDVEGDAAAGLTARSGMIRLLQRSIPRSKLIAVCAAEWERTASSADPRTSSIRELARLSAPGDAPRVYREIQSILEQK